MIRPILWICTAFAMMIAGCSGPPRDAGFGDVERQVASRSGQRVQWRQPGKAEESAVQSVRQMLVDELTAEEAVQIALLNNRRLQAVYEDLGVARADMVQAGLLNNPVFSAAVRFVETGGPVELQFGVAQEFLSIFFIPLRKAVASAAFERAKLQVTGRVLDLGAQTLADFYRAQAAEQLLEMRRQVLTATTASFELARRLRQAGNLTAVEYGNEQALHEQAKLDLAAAEVEVNGSRERLNSRMGLWGRDTHWTISPRLPEVDEDFDDLDGMEKRAVVNSLDLAIARQDILAFGQRLGLNKAAALIPSAEVGFDAEREDVWEMGPTLSVPIPIFDLGQARIAKGRAELRRARQDYMAQAVEVRAAIRAARQRMLATQQIAGHYRDVMLPLRIEILDQTQLQFNAMQVSGFELLLAKQRQIDTGRRYIEALRDYWLSRTQLEQVLRGRLTDLGLEESLVREIELPDQGPRNPGVND